MADDTETGIENNQNEETNEPINNTEGGSLEIENKEIPSISDVSKDTVEILPESKKEDSVLGPEAPVVLPEEPANSEPESRSKAQIPVNEPLTEKREDILPLPSSKGEEKNETPLNVEQSTLSESEIKEGEENTKNEEVKEGEENKRRREVKENKENVAEIPVVLPVKNLARELLGKARNVLQFRKRKKLEKIMSLFDKIEKGSVGPIKITNDMVEKLLRVSDATATRYLSDLEKDGKILKNGKKGRFVFYTKK